jgi:hypothetical protein
MFSLSLDITDGHFFGMGNCKVGEQYFQFSGTGQCIALGIICGKNI